MLIAAARQPMLLILIAIPVALGLQLAAFGIIFHLLQRAEVPATVATTELNAIEQLSKDQNEMLIP